MREFIAKHQDRLEGVVPGFEDPLVFHGYVRGPSAAVTA